MKPLNLASINISGLNLIEASAGTGKTWTIAALYILLLLEKELRPDQILVVTYTKAATAELRDRIRARIISILDLYNSGREASSDDLEQLLMTFRPQNSQRAIQLLLRALYSFDDAAIYTIHGFCQRALLENTFESGSLFGSTMISDQDLIVKQVCDDFWRARILSQPIEFIEYLEAKGYTPEKLAAPLAGYFQNPDLIIIPHVDEILLSPLIIERDRLYQLVCDIWKSDRSIIIKQLEDARLNQQSYKSAQIETAAGILDSWVTVRNPAHPNSKLDFFSRDRIASKTTKTSLFTPDHTFFFQCQSLSETLDTIETAFRNKIITCRHDLKKWLERELQQRKRALNLRSFDDLLIDLSQALESQSGTALAGNLRQRYRAAMIDEFQDTDPLQWNIFKHIGAEQDYPLFLIGDPKQAIYRFRGADVFAYLNAGRYIAPERTQTLDKNYRSDSALVRAVNTLFMSCPDPFFCRDIPFHPVTAGRSETDKLFIDSTDDKHPLKFWVYRREDETKSELKPSATRAIVHAVAEETVRLLEPGRAEISKSGRARTLRPGDISVLVKSHKQADLVQEAFTARGIPSVQQGSTTIFSTPEALDLLRIMRAAAEPYREDLLREALLTASMGVNANLVARYLESPDEHPEWDIWLANFQDLHAAAASGGIIALVSRLLGRCGVRTQVLTRFCGERSLTNILHCSELLHQTERELGKSLVGLISWLERKIQTPDRSDASLLRLETDENAVMISTIHASKGLQYPVVFVPFAWDPPSVKNERALFHDTEGDLVLDLAGSAENSEFAAAEQKAESARLLYVALTRAEFRCYTVWGRINGAVDSPLFQLLHTRAASGLDKRFSEMNDREIVAELQQLSCDGDSGITAELMPGGGTVVHHHPETTFDRPYTCRSPLYPIRDSWKVASFSGITSGAGHTFEPHDHDSLQGAVSQITVSVTTDSDLPPEGLTLFDFPRGAQAGTCLHGMLEQLDFQALDSDTIASLARSSLEECGFQEKWLPAVKEMILQVTSTRIIPDDRNFTLAQLKQGDWQTEMEFFLPIRQLTPATLQSLFEGILENNRFGEFFEVLQNLSFRQSSGMLQGFIDLIFTHNDRFYLLDWKSNYLGPKKTDYNPESMHDSMCRSAYVLQYHLYTLALDRLLKSRLPDYRYEKHFGGSLYLYLRGVSADSTTNGIYFGRPLPEFISRAGDVLLA